MARIPAVDSEQTRGVRKLLFWVNKRQYGGAVPPFTTSWRDLNYFQSRRSESHMKILGLTYGLSPNSRTFGTSHQLPPADLPAASKAQIRSSVFGSPL